MAAARAARHDARAARRPVGQGRRHRRRQAEGALGARAGDRVGCDDQAEGRDEPPARHGGALDAHGPALGGGESVPLVEQGLGRDAARPRPCVLRVPDDESDARRLLPGLLVRAAPRPTAHFPAQLIRLEKIIHSV